MREDIRGDQVDGKYLSLSSESALGVRVQPEDSGKGPLSWEDRKFVPLSFQMVDEEPLKIGAAGFWLTLLYLLFSPSLSKELTRSTMPRGARRG